jgi:hypothetical protein
MAHAEHPAAGLAHHGEGFGHQGVKGFPLRVATAELLRLGAQSVVGKRRNGSFKRVDAGDGL